MKISLGSPARKAVFLGTCLLLAGVYVGFAGRQFLASYFSTQLDLLSLQRAARLEPGNAFHQYRLGHYFLQTQHEPETAARFLKTATTLNPGNASYWIELATAYRLLADPDLQKDALRHAVAADPSTPEVAWNAANFFWSIGETTDALREFGVVLAADPNLSPEALDRCWRIRPDVNALMKDVIPRNSGAYSSFLDFLISRSEPAAAANVWSQMVQLQQPVETNHILGYVQYLLGQRNVPQARQVWRQAASFSELSGYQPSSDNLVVNGDFSLAVLNGGFDWQYWKSLDVSLAIDPTESHSGPRSLSIVFDSRGMEDVGIQQLIPVQPNSTYRFSAHFKSEGMEGAGGPRFLLEDQFTGASVFASEELKDADFWKQVEGTFITGADTTLLRLRIQRVPAGDAIRGKLWIDGVHLAEEPEAGGGY